MIVESPVMLATASGGSAPSREMSTELSVMNTQTLKEAANGRAKHSDGH
jgi:hypothetical protein